MPLSLLDERVAVWYRGIMAAIRSDARIRSYKVQFYFKGPEARELQQTPTEDLCASSRWAKKIEIYVERLSLPVAFDTIYFSGGNVVEIAYDRPGRQGNVRWSDEQDDEDEDGIDTNMEDEEGSEMYDDGNITQGDNVSPEVWMSWRSVRERWNIVTNIPIMKFRALMKYMGDVTRIVCRTEYEPAPKYGMEINHDTHVNAWLVPSWVRNPAKYYDNIRPVETFVRPVGYRVIFPAEQGSNTEVTPQTIGIPPEHAKSIHSTSAPRSQSAGSTGTLQEKRQGRQDPIACSVPPLRLHAGQCIPSRGPSTTQGVTDSPAHLSRSQAEKVTGSSQKISLIVTEHPAIPPQLAKRKREDGTGYGNIGQDAPTRPNKVRVLDSQIGSSGTAQTFPVPAPVPAQYITQESSATPQCLDPNTVAALDQDYRKELSNLRATLYNVATGKESLGNALAINAEERRQLEVSNYWLTTQNISYREETDSLREQVQRLRKQIGKDRSIFLNKLKAAAMEKLKDKLRFENILTSANGDRLHLVDTLTQARAELRQQQAKAEQLEKLLAMEKRRAASAEKRMGEMESRRAGNSAVVPAILDVVSRMAQLVDQAFPAE